MTNGGARRTEALSGHVCTPAYCRDTTWRLETEEYMWRMRVPRRANHCCPAWTFRWFLLWWQTHPWSITSLPRVFKYILSWLESIQTESGFFSALLDSHILCHAHSGLLIIPVWFWEKKWFVWGAWRWNCLNFVSQASFEQEIHSDSLKLAAVPTIRHRALMDGVFNLRKRAGLCLRYTFYGPL